MASIGSIGQWIGVLLILVGIKSIWGSISSTASKNAVQIGFIIFFSGFVINELLLFTVGLFSWLHITMFHFYMEGLLIASILLSFGIGILWSANFVRQKML